jgi:hypothetical protein
MKPFPGWPAIRLAPLIPALRFTAILPMRESPEGKGL